MKNIMYVGLISLFLLTGCFGDPNDEEKDEEYPEIDMPTGEVDFDEVPDEVLYFADEIVNVAAETVNVDETKVYIFDDHQQISKEKLTDLERNPDYGMVAVYTPGRSGNPRVLMAVIIDDKWCVTSDRNGQLNVYDEFEECMVNGLQEYYHTADEYLE